MPSSHLLLHTGLGLPQSCQPWRLDDCNAVRAGLPWVCLWILQVANYAPSNITPNHNLLSTIPKQLDARNTFCITTSLPLW